jgi:hypothetical protein
VQSREPDVPHRHFHSGPSVAGSTHGGRHMLMFKRSQIYIGLGLAAIVELVIRFTY